MDAPANPIVVGECMGIVATAHGRNRPRQPERSGRQAGSDNRTDDCQVSEIHNNTLGNYVGGPVGAVGGVTIQPGKGQPTVTYLLKNDAFCIKNDEFCIKNDEFCIKDDEFCIKNTICDVADGVYLGLGHAVC